MLGLALSRNAVLVYAMIGLIAWAHLAVQKHDQKVASVAVAKIEKATDNATLKGKRAAVRAVSPGVRGTRDPSTRDD